MLSRLSNNSLFLKLVMAITGVAIFVWLILHVSGNMSVFLGAEKMNHYASFLHEAPALLWGQRVGLGLVVVAHVWSSLKLTLRNRAARPVGYQKVHSVVATLPAKSMRVTAILLLTFLVYHLLHMTLLTVHPDPIVGDAYHNLTVGLAAPGVAAFYVVAMLCLLVHLRHGLWSFFQTLGWNHPKYNPLRTIFAVTASGALTFGFIIIPVAIVSGFIQ